MPFFQNLPLRHKLTLLSLITSAVAMVLVCAAFVADVVLSFKRELVSDVETAAAMIGYNAASALSFDDAQSGEETLNALKEQPNIVLACIYDHNRRLFAAYPRTQSRDSFGPAAHGEVNRFGANRLEIFRPIKLKGQEIGSIYLRSDFRDMRARLRHLAWISGASLAVVILVAYLLAIRLQRVISVPVSDLAVIVGRVAVEKDYSIRAVKQGHDELGRLIDGFNEMLGQIQARDGALQSAHDRLEHRVQERTAKLAEASGLLEALLTNSPDLIYFKDLQSRFVRFSSACYKGFALSGPEQLLGRTDFDFYSAGQAQPGYNDEQEIIRTGQPNIGKLEKVSYADGRVAWVLTTKMPWRDGTGSIVGTFGVSKDVTTLKETEDKLAYERDQARALFATIPDLIYFKDRESHFVLVSRSKVSAVLSYVPDLVARRASHGLPAGVPEAEILNGLTDFDTYESDDARRAGEDEQQIVRTGEPVIGKLEKQAFLNGSVRWLLTSKMPWRDREGKIIGTFGISKDITDLKEAEQKLDGMNRQLVESSRLAGMAEVATGVLHNVGNVLNSVNVSATLVASRVRHSKGTNLTKLGALLKEHKPDLAEFLTNDSRGRMIPIYLETLAESLADERQSLISELEHLCKNIDHIKEIVAMQQAHASTSGITGTISVTEMIEDALRINAGMLNRHEVTTVRDFQVHPVIITDKHKVMQILINLLRNAKLACVESGRGQRQITVRTTSDERNVNIAIIDNGVGIPAENLLRIFNHGFTTRKDGHGFGLHSGALAAREVGGSLTVQSDGAGLGATFVLTLPLALEAVPS